jgi:hypothetical protein
MSIPKEDIPMEKIVELLKKSEDDGTFYGSIYNLYFLIGVAKSVDDIKNGQGITLEEFNKEREALYESYSRQFG